MANKVIENKENITFFEKHFKTLIVFAMLCCFMGANIDKVFEERPSTGFEPKLSEIFNINVLIDMKRELIMLFGSWGLYICARKYNSYLDRLEEEEEERAKQEEAGE